MLSESINRGIADDVSCALQRRIPQVPGTPYHLSLRLTIVVNNSIDLIVDQARSDQRKQADLLIAE